MAENRELEENAEEFVAGRPEGRRGGARDLREGRRVKARWTTCSTRSTRCSRPTPRISVKSTPAGGPGRASTHVLGRRKYGLTLEQSTAAGGGSLLAGR